MYSRMRQIIYGGENPNMSPLERPPETLSSILWQAQPETHSHGLTLLNIAFKDLVTNYHVFFYGVEKEIRRKEGRKLNYEYYTSQKLIFDLLFLCVCLFTDQLMKIEVSKRESLARHPG